MKSSILHLCFWNEDLNTDFYIQQLQSKDELIVFCDAPELVKDLLVKTHRHCKQTHICNQYDYSQLLDKLESHHKTWTWK